jgi:hypothetical protein
MLHLILWKWTAAYRDRFTAEHVNIAAAMVRRHYPDQLRIVCVTDDPAGVECETVPLWDDGNGLHNASGVHLPSCYRRLKLFARDIHHTLGCAPGDPLVSLDLDMVVTGGLGPLWNPHVKSGAPFVGWLRKGSYHARVYNGSMWLVRAGALPQIWEEFDPASSPLAAKMQGYLGSDQAWMSWKLGPGRPCWTDKDGVYHFAQDVRAQHRLPQGARLVIFCGQRKPWHAEVQATDPWVKEYYHA